MKKLLSKLTACAAVGLAAIMAMPSSAYASGTTIGGGAVVGAGTIFPGLTTVSTPQTNITFKGTVVGAFVITSPNDLHVSVGELECSFNGASDIAENSALGMGHGMVMCINLPGGTVVHSSIPTGVVPAPATVTVTCERFDYVRVAAVVVTPINRCTVTVSSANGSTSGDVIVVGVFVFVPTSPPLQPVTTYSLAGIFGALPALV